MGNITMHWKRKKLHGKKCLKLKCINLQAIFTWTRMNYKNAVDNIKMPNIHKTLQSKRLENHQFAIKIEIARYEKWTASKTEIQRTQKKNKNK